MSLIFSRTRIILNPRSTAVGLRTAATGSSRSLSSLNNLKYKSGLPSCHFAPLSIIPQARFVATSVSNKPASQNVRQTALNVKEETSNFAGEAAKMISGARLEDAGASFVRFLSHHFRQCLTIIRLKRRPNKREPSQGRFPVTS
jgi:hypothetical protein